MKDGTVGIWFERYLETRALTCLARGRLPRPLAILARLVGALYALHLVLWARDALFS